MKGIRNLFITLLITANLAAYAQQVRVPVHMEFAGIKLKINDAARAEIQKDVDALTQNEKFLLAKLKRVEEYFPIVEKIFREEGLPLDFKYLAIQESAFIGDAVSSSDAVGYWQFKREAAEEMGLRIDSKVDGRMHIMASTRAAAQYLQKNNYYFNNWLNALQAYQMGPGGAMDALGDKDNGANSMNINKRTYWYVKKFLAHKIVFEDALGRYDTKAMSVVPYQLVGNKSLRQIASELKIDEEELKPYNLWIKGKRIPPDNEYPVMVPVKSSRKKDFLAANKLNDRQNIDFNAIEGDVYPTIEGFADYTRPFMIKINGLQAIVAGEEMEREDLASFAGIKPADFSYFNDLKSDQPIHDGEIYYLERKRSKSKVYYHTVKNEESLWLISQKYGLKILSLIRKNHLNYSGEITPGLVLWLRKKRPRWEEPEYMYISENATKEAEINNNMSESYLYHEVEKGDTMYMISRKYGVSVDFIKSVNNRESTILKEGEKLIVKRIPN